MSLLSPYLFGITSSLLTSPCSTPILASLLLSLSSQPTSTTVLSLFAYTLGYSSLLLAASFTGKQLVKGGEWQDLVGLGLGAVLVFGGGTQVLDGLLGVPGA